MALEVSGGPSSRRMDETPQDVERELRARVVVDEPEPIPSPPDRTPPRVPLRRRATGRWVAGVAGGVADRLGLPALVLRIPLGIAALIWVLVGLSALFDDNMQLDLSQIGVPDSWVVLSFAAIVAYVVLWVVLPREDIARSPAGRFLDRYPGLRSAPGLVLLAIGGALLADQLGIWKPEVAVAIGLIALGVWLYRRDARPVEVDRVSVDRVAVAGSPSSAAVPGAAIAEVAPVAPRAPRERSPLGWIAFGAALLVVCVAAISASVSPSVGGAGEATGVSRIAAIPALVLLVLAAGLIVGSVYGRARWLILPALLLVPVVLIASVIRLPLEGRFGDQSLYPMFPGQLAGSYTTTAGKIYVDLNRFQGRDEIVDLPLRASTVIGNVTIVLPYDASFRVRASTGLGSISFGRHYEDGVEVSASGESVSKYEGGPSFVFDLEAGIGSVSVFRNAPTKKQLREIRREIRRQARLEAR